MPALTRRDRLPTLQRRRMAELRAVAHLGVDVEHAPLADECVPTDPHRAGVDVAGLGAKAEHRGLLAQDGVVANRNEVRADWHGARLDDRVVTELRAKKHEVEAVERAALKHHDRSATDQRFNDPEAVVAPTPDREGFLFPSADERPLADDGEGCPAEEEDNCQHRAADVEPERLTEHLVDPLQPVVGAPQQDEAVAKMKHQLCRAARPIGQAGSAMGRL